MPLSDIEEPLIVSRAREQTKTYGALKKKIVSSESGESSTPFIDNQQIQEKDVNVKVYSRRWYILFVFGMMSMTNCAVWNTFSPISEIGEHVFGWNTASLSLLTNWGPISYVIGTFAFSWILEEKGLRPACMLSGFLILVGTGVRCITAKPSIATPLIHFGQFLNGLAGPIAMGAPPAVSAEWFPPEQRTTATAIAYVTNTLGLAVSFLLGPYLVPVRKLHDNSTTSVNSSEMYMDYANTGDLTYFSTVSNTSTHNSSQYDVTAESDSVMRYMYYSFGWSVLCFVLFFTYFPSKPPLPPSPSASMERLEFKKGLIKLAKNHTFWLIAFTYGLSLGVFGCWSGVLDVNLKDHGISQDEAAWLGFYGVIAACVASIIAARGADLFARHIKWFLVIFFVLGGACFIVFALALIKVVPDNDGVIYSTYIMANLLLGATSPLYFEIACEVTYPTAEGVTNLVLTLVCNIFGLIFLLVQLLPIGTMWENWCLIGAIFVCVPVLLFLKERYNRLDIDLIVEEDK